MQETTFTDSHCRTEVRPWPSRAATEPERIYPENNLSPTSPRLRKKSEQHVLPGLSEFTRHPIPPPTSPTSAVKYKISTTSSSPSTSEASTIPTPPTTPRKWRSGSSSTARSYAKDMHFDFSRIDYELNRTRCIGNGLWSSVYLADPVVTSPKLSNNDNDDDDAITPPTTPRRSPPPELPLCRLFAIKSPARPDARDIFSHEAKILTKLQQSPQAHHCIVPFHGIDPRNSCLILEGVIGGSLEDLSSRLQNMTELARHLEIRQIFPGLAMDLIRGLEFIHSAGIVHADIKPANVLLDIVDEDTTRPMLRARYIDFSASFIRGEGGIANAGGTWDFMAPEQLRIQKELNEPTCASDVWSVGITLLSVITGGSPYTAACGNNLFMRREAIKSGDPLGFAQMEPVVHKRMAACQDFIDCCRLALQKDRERRCTAAAWEVWIGQQGFVHE